MKGREIMTNRETVEAILKLYDIKSSNQALKASFRELFPEKKIELHHIIIGIISLLAGILLKSNESTFIIFLEIIELLNSIIIALFGIVFTGYTLFQALIDSDVLKRMLAIKNGKTTIQISNDYFLNVMILDLFCIMLNTGLLVGIKIFPKQFLVNGKIMAFVIVILLSLYFSIQTLIIWEMKSFVFNIYRIFNVYAGSKAVEILKKDKERTNEDNSAK